MKKKLFCLLVSLVLMLTFAMPVSAAAEDVPFSYMVVDSDELLLEQEVAELNERAWEITQEYGCAVYIVTTYSLEGMTAAQFNEYIHSSLGMGYGSDQSCIILLLSTEYRDYDIMAHGYGNTAFTDYGKDVMASRILDDLAEDEWYDAFTEYLDCCEEYLMLAENGTPFDVGSGSESGKRSPVLGIIVSAAISSLVAFVVCGIFKSQMKTAGVQHFARNYISAEGLQLSLQNDVYLHTERTERYIEQKKEGGTTVNSSGSSHKSGKF